MKLRDKETGEIKDGRIEIVFQNNDKFPNPLERHTVESIAELNEGWEDYMEPDEPDPSLLIVKIQQLENSIKALDERLKVQAKKIDISCDVINERHSSLKELDERLKTVEEITERLLREDNEQILGNVKQMNDILERIKEIRAIQRKQRGEKE